ncbi:MAG: ADP-ribosylglycohydrolase family protein [Candidatus Thioglobus sp.]|nr:ADP-ribosylglycohydrolase family protein [Candidatus Thioglobus sp.]
MLGAIIGDVVGSVYEWNNIKHKDFSPLFSKRAFFTDDSVLTVALMDAIDRSVSYDTVMRWYYTQYPDAGYGRRFHHWCKYDTGMAYNSWGNGSAMRTSSVGYAYNSIEEVLEKAKHFASFTHDHPEGIKGAQATSACIFMARKGATKEAIRTYITNQFGYDLDRTIDDIRPNYKFNESCQGTVPEAIVAFLDSTDFEDAIRCAVSLGGDSDTLTCITGGIAEAFYGDIPQDIAVQAMHRLTPSMRDVVVKFYDKYKSSVDIRTIHRLAGQFVVAKPVEKEGAFHEQQQEFWKMVVKDERDKIIETKKISEKICLTVELRNSDEEINLTKIDHENWPGSNKDKENATVLGKIKQLLEL